MTYAYFLEQLINGLCQGSIYALFAIGYALIVGVVGLASFTHGEVIMIGSFAAYYCATLVTGNIFVNLLIAFCASAAIGFVIQKLCYEKFFDKKDSHIPLMCTIGISIVLKNLAQILFGTETKSMPEIIPSGVAFTIAGINISYVKVVVIAVVVCLCLLLYIFLSKTKAGIILRAVSQDRKTAALMGIDVKRATLLGNMIGCGIGGIGGMLYGMYYSSFAPTYSDSASIKAFSSTILGGMTDITVSALGGIIIGVLENFGVMLTNSSMRDVVAFAFLIIILIFMPQGLKIGRKRGR